VGTAQQVTVGRQARGAGLCVIAEMRRLVITRASGGCVRHSLARKVYQQYAGITNNCLFFSLSPWEEVVHRPISQRWAYSPRLVSHIIFFSFHIRTIPICPVPTPIWTVYVKMHGGAYLVG